MDVEDDEPWVNSEPDDENDSTDSELENAYYEAKSLLQEGGTEASVRFQEVVLMDEEKGKWGLKALKQLIKHECHQGQLEDAIKNHVEIVGYTKSVSGKALEKALRKILVYFSSANAAPDELKCLLEKFVESLEPLRENRPSVWCPAMLDVGRHYITTKNFAQATNLADRVLDYCMSDNGDMRAHRHLPEVFELQVSISFAAKDYDSVVKLCRKAQPYADALWNDKPISNIRELAGISLLRLGEFSKAEEEFKGIVRDYSTMTTEERNRRLDYFTAAYFLRRCFDKMNATFSGSMPASQLMTIDDSALESAKDHMVSVQMVSALVKAMDDEDLGALEVALNASVGRLDSQLLDTFRKWNNQIRCLRDRIANARTCLARGDLPFVHDELPKLEHLSRMVGGCSELRRHNYMMDVLALKADLCFEGRSYELLKAVCAEAYNTACTARKDLQRAAIIELYAKGQLRLFTADSMPMLSFAFNCTFHEASNMYASSMPEQAEMCALYAALADRLHRTGDWEQCAASNKKYGPWTRERQMVDNFCTAYHRGDIATLNTVRTELVASTWDTFLHEQLRRLESKLRRRLCLRTIILPAETWTVVFEYLRHRECHAPHEVSRNFRNILAPILRHPNILTVAEVSITSTLSGFYECTAAVRTVECGDKTSGDPQILYGAIDFVARLTSLQRVQAMNVDVVAYFTPRLLSAFCRYLGSVNVGRLTVDRLDFRRDWNPDASTLRNFIMGLKSVDEVCLEHRCSVSRAQVTDALMLDCRAKGIHHLDLRCAPTPTFEVTDAGLIDFCLGGNGTGRARYLSIRFPSISDEFFLHLYEAHQNAKHHDSFVLRMGLDQHQIETILKLAHQVHTTASLSPERDTNENGGAMQLRVEYGLADTESLPKSSRFVKITRF